LRITANRRASGTTTTELFANFGDGSLKALREVTAHPDYLLRLIAIAVR
jgi:hypothetical protein